MMSELLLFKKSLTNCAAVIGLLRRKLLLRNNSQYKLDEEVNVMMTNQYSLYIVKKDPWDINYEFDTESVKTCAVLKIFKVFQIWLIFYKRTSMYLKIPTRLSFIKKMYKWKCDNFYKNMIRNSYTLTLKNVRNRSSFILFLRVRQRLTKSTQRQFLSTTHGYNNLAQN